MIEPLDFQIEPANPPNEGILFVDHSGADRTGHLGHALVEYEPGKLLAFYPNCSNRNGGHNGDGWMEYKRSEDGGKTWSAPLALDYSKRVYESGEGRAVMCEKAIRADDGTIIVFNLECRNIPETHYTWQPLLPPTCLRSADGGRTWQFGGAVSDQPGRIYDVINRNGEILALELCNDSAKHWTGNQPDHFYGLYASSDNGRSFSLRSKLPFDVNGRGYGTMTILPDGGLIAYVYNIADEQHLDAVISHDAGRTWSDVRQAFMAKYIRNPQVAAFAGGYVLHGRSGSEGKAPGKRHFVLYTSPDGLLWDEGQYLRRHIEGLGLGAYSNNVLVHDPAYPKAPPRLLVQASFPYAEGKTNIYHWWLIHKRMR